MILDDLFDGKIYPSASVVPKSKAFQETTKEVENIMDYFEQKMSKDDYEKLEELNDKILESQSMLCKEQFKSGFVLGILMAQEVHEYEVRSKKD